MSISTGCSLCRDDDRGEHADKRDQEAVGPTIKSKCSPDIARIRGAAAVSHQRIVHPDAAIAARTRKREPVAA